MHENAYSIHRCVIKEVKEDFNDLTLGVSNNILGGMGAESYLNRHHMVVISY